jgi:hypothetical protein
MRIPIEAYLKEEEAKVYSFVAAVPFSPIDVDLGRLARGEWNALTDRFRIWYMPGEVGVSDSQLCYMMVRKYDPQNGVLAYLHIMVNLGAREAGAERPSFIVGILSNDDVRARAAFNAMLDIPPAFHRRSELRVLERRWRSDPGAVMRFAANVHSVVARPEEGGPVYNLKFGLLPGMADQLKQSMGAWWSDPGGPWPSRIPSAPGSSGHGRPGR